MIIRKIHDEFVELVFTGYLDSNDFLAFKVEFINSLSKRNCLLFNMVGISGVDITIVTDLSTFMNTYESLIRNNLVASAILLSNGQTATLVRNVLKTLFVIRKPTKPNIVSSDITECIEHFKDNWELVKLKKN